MWRRGMYCEALLHQSFERSGKENPGEQQEIPNPGSSSQQIESHTHACSSPKHGEIKLALPIVPVKVRAKGQTVYYYTHALLDSGSTKTFCSDALNEKHRRVVSSGLSVSQAARCLPFSVVKEW